MMSQIPQIKTVIPISNAVFSHMTYDFISTTASQLDMIFSANYGERAISPILQRMLVDPLAITDLELQSIANLVTSVYGKKWDRYKEIYLIQYDKIHNYLDEYTETSTISTNEDTVATNNSVSKDTITDTSTNTRTDNLSKSIDNDVTKSDTSTRTDNLTKTLDETITKNDTGSETDSVYGFNSTSASNAQSSQTTEGGTTTDKSTVKDTGTQENSLESTTSDLTSITDTGTQKNDFSSNNVKDVTKDTDITSSTDEVVTKAKTYKHQGNIGNLTTQSLIREELKLWEWNFIESILNDVKDLLTLPIYL